MGRKSRDKGATYEREVCRAIFDHLGVEVKRNLSQYQESGLGDIVLGDWLIECKRHKTAKPSERKSWWWETREQAATAGLIPCLWYRPDFEPSRVVIPMSEVTRCDCISADSFHDDYEWTATISPEAFFFIVREGMT